MGRLWEIGYVPEGSVILLAIHLAYSKGAVVLFDCIGLTTFDGETPNKLAGRVDLPGSTVRHGPEEITSIFEAVQHELRNDPFRDLDVRKRWSGRPDRLPEDLAHALRREERRTRDRTGLTLTICLDYGGRDEITRTAAALAQAAREGDVDPHLIGPDDFARHLPHPDMPDVDLLWRTGNAPPTSSPGTPPTPSSTSPPTSGPTSTDVTCGKPSPNTADANAATAPPLSFPPNTTGHPSTSDPTLRTDLFQQWCLLSVHRAHDGARIGGTQRSSEDGEPA